MILNNRWALALIVVFGVPAVLIGYVALIEWFLGLLPYKARTAVRPWFWVGPALLLLALFLVYPSINTIYLSLLGPNSKKFVGVANYLYFFTNSGTLESLRNNALWLVLLTALTVGFGMLFAVLFDRVKYEATAK